MKIKCEKIKTKDNFELDVEIRFPENQIKSTVVMCHGLTSSKHGRKEQLLKIANKLCENGFKVIQFDWRGHGKSSGNDLDVSPKSFYIDITTIINNYVLNDEEYYLFGFSFGGFAVNQFLHLTKNKSVKKVALIGPPLEPINSSLLNPKEFCYQEISDAQKSGQLEREGYVLLKSKNWRISKQFLDECYEYDYKEAIKYLSNRTLLLQGKNDRNVDKDYNERHAKEYNIQYKEYEASHSLVEVIDEVVLEILKFYNS